jgi:hypothetical protein
MYYEWEEPWSDNLEGVLIDEVIDFSSARFPGEVGDIRNVLQKRGGMIVHLEGWEIDREYGFEKPDHVDWVTPMTTFNRKAGAFVVYGNEPSLGMAYVDVCMVVRIGKAGTRLEYPTLAQLKRVTQREDRTSSFWRRND